MSCLSEDAVLDTVDRISENTPFLVSTADDGSIIAVREFVNLVISGITVEVTVEIEFCILFIVTTGDRPVISGLSVTSFSVVLARGMLS